MGPIAGSPRHHRISSEPRRCRSFSGVISSVDRDRELIGRCVSGDAAAWSEFVRSYIRLVVHVIRTTFQAKSGRAAEEDVEDVAHDFYAGLVEGNFRALRALEEPFHLKAWLSVSARRKALDHLKRRRIRTVSLDQPVRGELALREILGAAADAGPEAGEEVRRALDGAPLTGKERLMITLYYFKGKSYDEISAVMSVPENSIGPTVRRALEKVRESLGKRGWVR